MPGKMTLVDFSRCHPEDCEDGICPAAEVCPRKMMRQEKPGQPPMTDPVACRACADCVRACPEKSHQNCDAVK